MKIGENCNFGSLLRFPPFLYTIFMANKEGNWPATNPFFCPFLLFPIFFIIKNCNWWAKISGWKKIKNWKNDQKFRIWMNNKIKKYFLVLAIPAGKLPLAGTPKRNEPLRWNNANAHRAILALHARIAPQAMNGRPVHIWVFVYRQDGLHHRGCALQAIMVPIVR